VAFRLVHLLLARFGAAKDIEILMLRHEFAVLPRHDPRAAMTWVDRALLSPGQAAAHPAAPTTAGIARTLLRWHAQLIDRAGPTRSDAQAAHPPHSRSGPGGWATQQARNLL
jgi:hypothetical protein